MVVTSKKSLNCDGLCDVCSTSETCADELCGQHTGQTAKISALQERVGDLEDRDSQVDNLTGRVNILINICLIIIAAIIGDFAHSIVSTKTFETRYTANRLALKDTIHALDMKLMTRIDDMSDQMSDDMQHMTEKVEEKIDDMAKETDKRFDTLERELPLIEQEVKVLRDKHRNDREN